MTGIWFFICSRVSVDWAQMCCVWTCCDYWVGQGVWGYTLESTYCSIQAIFNQYLHAVGTWIILHCNRFVRKSYVGPWKHQSINTSWKSDIKRVFLNFLFIVITVYLTVHNCPLHTVWSVPSLSFSDLFEMSAMLPLHIKGDRGDIGTHNYMPPICLISSSQKHVLWE